MSMYKQDNILECKKYEKINNFNALANNSSGGGGCFSCQTS